VLTQRVQFDIADDDHLVHFAAKNGPPHDLLRVLPVALRQKLHGSRRSSRRVAKPLPRWILTDRLNQPSKLLFHVDLSLRS